ncbi:hypothetical protein Vi05172_g13480 [Venturia inaequalis]|nr:hypothetical protein Vi05172_g13480 [Venturia inaequalis]
MSPIKEILIRREPALAWTFEECGKIRKEVTPAQVIRVIDYKP